jgi:hypothetical protein
MPEDSQWAADRKTVLKGLGILDPSGEPTGRLEVLERLDMVRPTEEAWREERDKMIGTCRQCHSVNFAKGELEKGDRMIQSTDGLMAQGIATVADLYRDNILKKPVNYPYAYPDLLTFHDAPTMIEQALFRMFLKHRMRAFQGAFHSNPDYSFWEGWSEMQRDLTEIKEIAARLRWEKSKEQSLSTEEQAKEPPVVKKPSSKKK